MHQQEYPTDKGHYDDIILSAKVKTFIISTGTCQPKGPFPKDKKNSSFSCAYYKNETTTSQPFPLKWLNYSLKKDCAYCLPCWLFSKSGNNKSGWADGIRDWQGLSRKIKDHGKSNDHILACMSLHQWKASKCIDDHIDLERKSQLTFWAQVLERLIDITLMLAKNTLAFRGANEGNYDGNFLSLVQLLAKYDPVMARVVTIPEGQTKYLSHDIQNQIISCISSTVLNGIVNKINKAQFFSLIVDTTQDLSKKDQMSFIVRYTHLSEVEDGLEGASSENREVKIEESFLGFFHVRDSTADGLSSLIVNCLEGFGLDMKKCRGQGYDGAATMSGAYAGVQSRIQGIEELAVYVHCAAHNLNLVINDAVSTVRDVANYFSALQSLYVFFGHSINRWDILSSLTNESEITLKKLNPTRWASRHDSILAVKLRYLDILKALMKISLESKKPDGDEVSEARRLMKVINNFQFVMLTVILSKVFTQLNIASKSLQGKETDLERASTIFQRSRERLLQMRNEYQNMKEEAVTLAVKWNVDPIFPQKRQPLVKKHFDELAEDYRFSDGDNLFKINVFYKLLDVINGQIAKRFSAVERVVQQFSVLFPKVLNSLSEKEILERAENLQKIYEKDIGPSLGLELLSLRESLGEEIAKCKKVFELTKLLFVDFEIMSSSFPEVLTALTLFLTLPVTVASAERSFSALKRIKSYLRSTMGQDRLSALGLIAINNAEASIIDKKELKNAFLK